MKLHPSACVSASAVIALVLSAQIEPSVRAQGPGVETKISVESICRTLAQAAADNGLPVDFFARLIWQESRFNPSAVSWKGAQGIAQFMPGTAALRGLSNPFEPLTALRESASYLRELRNTFRGNLGLASAAYNAGPGRVEAWLAGRRSLPRETRNYVLTVTGHTADAWASPTPPQWRSSDIPQAVGCGEIANLMEARARPTREPVANPAWGPWGVQLTANWSEGQVLATYERLRRAYSFVLQERLPLVLRGSRPGRRGATRYVVRVSETTRAGAEALCGRLRAAGGACAVFRNSSAGSTNP